jgi:NADH dehydrogenase FAD-containing subunit
VVLAGGGHAHLEALANVARLTRAGARVTLVSPSPFHYYSGMGPGLLSGDWDALQARFDVRRLVERGGGSFLQDRVVGVSPAERLLLLGSGRALPYDVVSFNVGSRVPLEALAGAEQEGVPVKPIENLLGARERLLASLPAGRPRVLVVGGGSAGVELAGNTWRLARREGGEADITLVAADPRLLPAFPERASRLAEASLRRRGVRVVTDRRIASLASGVARTAEGKELGYDLCLLTIGIRPPEVFRGSGLATSERGALLVDDRLQSVSHAGVFGGGDCVELAGRALAQVGVYAVRQAPVLLRNLLASVKGAPLTSFRPQRRYLLILNLGDGTGLLVRGSWCWAGRLALRCKHLLDARFVARFQTAEKGESSESA